MGCNISYQIYSAFTSITDRPEFADLMNSSEEVLNNVTQWCHSNAAESTGLGAMGLTLGVIHGRLAVSHWRSGSKLKAVLFGCGSLLGFGTAAAVATVMYKVYPRPTEVDTNRSRAPTGTSLTEYRQFNQVWPATTATNSCPIGFKYTNQSIFG